MPQDINDIPSPCVRNCCLDTNDICLGCGRHLDEITGWTSLSNIQKQETLKKAVQRLIKLNR